MPSMNLMMKMTVVVLVFCLLAACAPVMDIPTQMVLPSPVVILKAPKLSVTPYPTPTRASTWTPEVATPTVAGPLSTPDPFTPYFVNTLRSRPYGGGQLENLGILGSNQNFVRYSIRYPSDGLQINGFMNLPNGNGPFPVIIVLHGYSDPSTYQTLDSTTDAADALTLQNYIVLHPNFRNFQPSDKGDTLFRSGYAVDILNLISILRTSAGIPGLFEHANADRIGLWGHSMGGEIALKVAVVSPYIKAILLYAPLSGDEQKNCTFFNSKLGGTDNHMEMTASAQDFAAISANTYYKNITAAIQIHHGTGDSVIPATWSQQTCQQLKDTGRNVQCFFYPGADHTFRAVHLKDFQSRVDDFFAYYLKK